MEQYKRKNCPLVFFKDSSVEEGTVHKGSMFSYFIIWPISALRSFDFTTMKWLIPVYTAAFDFSNEIIFVESKSTIYDF